jgi:hypothetical protein
MPTNDNHRIDIVYVVVCYEAATSGVYKKIADQVQIWREAGLTSKLVVLTDGKSMNLWKEIDSDCIVMQDSHIFSKIINRLRIYRTTKKINPRVVYFRDSFPMIMRSRKSSYVAVEIQSALESEITQRRPWIRSILPLARRIQFSTVDKFIFVSGELANLNQRVIQQRQLKVVSNGINFDRVMLLAPTTGDLKRAFFIGHPDQNWQGFDQVVRLAESCPEVTFEVVGIPASEEYPSNLNCYGELEETEYISIAAKCVVALGTLALNRKSLKEASPLKVRECLAMGLPVAIRYRDSDFSNEDFIFQFPDNDQDIANFAPDFMKFMAYWEGKRVPRERIQIISAKAKEQSRLEFLGLTKSAQF